MGLSRKAHRLGKGEAAHARLGRSRRRRRFARRVPIGVNLAPMIDMTFLLLIFFLVTSTFERAEGILASTLPDLGPARAVPLPISPVVIRLSSAGTDGTDYALSVDQFPDAPPRLQMLPAFLRALHQQPGFDDQTPVIIIARDDVRWDHVVECWNAALRADCKRIAFGEP